jgi:hypothetical protein
VVQETWNEDDYEYETVQPQPQQLRQRQYESIQYEEDVEEDNWSEATPPDRYQAPRYAEPEPYKKKDYAEDYEDYELGDAWADEPKPVNIPKKIKQPEYEEEDRY